MKNPLTPNELIELIFGYITKISAERSVDNILLLLADMGRSIVHADRCTVWMLSRDGERLWTKVAHGIEPIEIPIHSGIVGHAIARQERIIINDAYSDPRFNSEVDKQTGYTTKSLMVIPMFNHDGKIIGAFQVINKLGDERLFDEEDLNYIMLAATYAAETVEASLLIEEIDATQKEVIFTMGAIGEARSKETGNHVKRVAEYSRILALNYGLDSKEAEMLKQASPMHDIGKLAIPDSILNKPAGFTRDEYIHMMTHAKLGYDMLNYSPRKLLKAAATVAYEHHEHYDGSGYPRGIKGEEIHIYGRITALADVFDALGSDRCYKKAWEDEKTFEYIKKKSGTQFDPRLVEVFFENIDEILDVRERYKDEFDHE